MMEQLDAAIKDFVESVTASADALKDEVWGRGQSISPVIIPSIMGAPGCYEVDRTALRLMIEALQDETR